MLARQSAPVATEQRSRLESGCTVCLNWRWHGQFFRRIQAQTWRVADLVLGRCARCVL